MEYFTFQSKSKLKRVFFKEENVNEVLEFLLIKIDNIDGFFSLLEKRVS